ncbi:hypothetical protein [Streptomyces lunaelactis]|uniref:hypothetical protein n=1 Tax=Streptomyces lunaelactis TaxID=1535768 RepID=UPI001584699E|nr:hypothetical protein [Streptomyces lunaelactis]
MFDHQKQQLAAVSRFPGQLDVFVIGFDNRVWTTFWNENTGWNADFFPLPGGAVFDHEKQQLAAVSRFPGQLDVFVIGFDNRVWTTFWNENTGWNADFFPLPGGAVFDHEKQQLAAVSRFPGQLDVFVIGFDNRVWTTFWNENTGWNADFFPLPGGAVFDHEKQQLAAVSRFPGQLDVFVIGFDNRVWTTFWNENTGWNADFFPLPGGAVFDHQKQQLAAVSRFPGQLDVFVIGFDNRVWTTFWNENTGWNADFFPLPGGAVFDHQKQQLAAVSRFPGQLDVFVIGFDNRVWTTFWNENTGWNADFFPLPGGAVFDHQKQQLAAVSRFPGQLDVLVIGLDNRVWTTFWNESLEPMPRLSITLRAITVSGEGRFIEVSGLGFTPGKNVKLGYDIFSGGGPTTHQLGEDAFTSDSEGRFARRIRVNLTEISGAQVQATDEASNAAVTASL